MKAGTREMVRLALANDESVSADLTQHAIAILENGHVNHNDSQAEPLLMTMSAAARYLGVCRVTMWRMVKEGVLKPVEITPRVFRIRREDVLKFASKRTEYNPTPRGTAVA